MRKDQIGTDWFDEVEICWIRIIERSIESVVTNTNKLWIKVTARLYRRNRLTPYTLSYRHYLTYHYNTNQSKFVPERCPTLRIAFSPIKPRAPRADRAFSSEILGSVCRTLRVTTSVAVASWSCWKCVMYWWVGKIDEHVCWSRGGLVNVGLSRINYRRVWQGMHSCSWINVAHSCITLHFTSHQ